MDSRLGIQLVKAQYRTTTTDGVNFRLGWYCNKCFYTPGASDGPPQEKCCNCNQNLYVDKFCDEFNKAYATLIFVHKTKWGFGFKVTHDFKSDRMIKHEDAKFYRNKIEDLEKEVRVMRSALKRIENG